MVLGPQLRAFLLQQVTKERHLTPIIYMSVCPVWTTPGVIPAVPSLSRTVGCHQRGDGEVTPRLSLCSCAWMSHVLSKYLQRTSERCRHSGFGLSCHGNCSRCGLSGSKEESRDDLERFGEKRKPRKKERRREGAVVARRCFIWRCCSSVTTTMFSLQLLTILLSPLTEVEWN